MNRFEPGVSGVEIRDFRTDDVPALAEILASQDPWRKLGFGRDDCRRLLERADQQILTATDSRDHVVALAGWVQRGVIGQPYLNLLAVSPGVQGRGIGAALLREVEHRAFETSRNLFLCVSGFNERARRFYLREGYEEIGVIQDFLVAGCDEVLMRKSLGPLRG